jgi:hypothetical protein
MCRSVIPCTQHQPIVKHYFTVTEQQLCYSVSNCIRIMVQHSVCHFTCAAKFILPTVYCCCCVCFFLAFIHYCTVCTVLHNETEQVGSDLYSGGTKFKSWLWHRLSWLRFFMGFFSSSRQMLGQYLKLDQAHFLPMHQSLSSNYSMLYSLYY